MTTKEGVHVAEALLRPTRLYRAVDVLTRPTPVPASAGIYAWYFNEVAPGIDPSGCHRHDDLVLLYAGISPKAPPTNGRKPSRSTLRQRLRTHYAGNAEGSTLRLTLGCLLASQLRFRLRRVGSGHRYTFTNPGEQLLDQWMADHAFVTWVEIDGLWEAEAKLLSSGLRLPLNLAGCTPRLAKGHVEARVARRDADLLDIVADNGGPDRASEFSKSSYWVQRAAFAPKLTCLSAEQCPLMGGGFNRSLQHRS